MTKCNRHSSAHHSTPNASFLPVSIVWSSQAHDLAERFGRVGHSQTFRRVFRQHSEKECLGRSVSSTAEKLPKKSYEWSHRPPTTMSTERDPDAKLVARAQRGDKRAFGELVERHQAKLFTLAARTLGSETDAADAVQEALIRAWVALPRFRATARFSTWLYRITMNAAHDQRLKRKPEPTEVATETIDPGDPFARSELSGELQQALNALDEDFRLAVVLYDVLGCPYDEIAQLTDVPEGTVKSRIYRGRKELARLLGTPTAQSESKLQ